MAVFLKIIGLIFGIIGILLALIIILLCFAVHVYLSYDEKGLVVKGRYLFIPFKIYPPKAKKPKKVKKKALPKEKSSEEKKPAEEKKSIFKELFSGLEEIIREEGILGAIDYFKTLFSMMAQAVKSTVRSIIIKKAELNIIVGDEDAAEAAVSYGKICGGVYPAIAALQLFLKVKKIYPTIGINFLKEKTEISADVHTYVRPIKIIFILLRLLFKFLWYNISNKNNKNEDPPSNSRNSKAPQAHPAKNLAENSQT